MKKEDQVIDMVYLWCSEAEPEFRKRLELYRCENVFLLKNVEVSGSVRFYDNSELKYSLRSLELNVPWINHVYIVTDRQVPEWLDINYEKVTIIDHSEIMPLEMIPCFNSTVIERYLPFIPGLSEYFLYGNDDMFFGKPLPRDYFFRKNKPIVRVMYDEKNKTINSNDKFISLRETKDIFQLSCLNSWKIMNNMYCTKEFFKSHHNIDAYIKSSFLETLAKYKNNFEKNQQRFRNEKNIQRIIFNLDAAYSGKAELEIIPRIPSIVKHLWPIVNINFESYCGVDNDKSFKEIKRFKPNLFCINSVKHPSESIKLKSQFFFEYMFPNASKFEL